MVYKWYILPIGGLYATYHPLQEQEESVEFARLVMVSATSVEEKMTTTIFTKKNITKLSWMQLQSSHLLRDSRGLGAPNNKGFLIAPPGGHWKTWSFKTWLKGCSNCSSSHPYGDHEVGRIQ